MSEQICRFVPPVLRATWLFALVAAASTTTLAGCWDSSPCDAGQVVRQNHCYAAIAEGGGGEGGGGGAGGGMAGMQPAADEFSYKTCATDADCGGQTPNCTGTAVPPSTTPYCTNGPCLTGAEDTCPVGGHCTDKFAAFGPNFCAKD